MSQANTHSSGLPRQCSGLLKDQVQVVKRKNSDRYEIVQMQDPLSFEKGFFVVIRACQLLAQKNEGIIFVGLAGPCGAGKTVFTEKILNFMPSSIAVITMDNYNDASRIVDGNFDDPRSTDYDTLLENIRGLKEGNPVETPIYDFKSGSRIGYRTIKVPSSRIVIVEGIYALSDKLRPFLDLRVSVTGGVHFDLVKRVFRDIQRAGQEPAETIPQISETVYPLYKAFMEPDLQTAHIKIINKFSLFSGFKDPTYILKSTEAVTEVTIKEVLFDDYSERTEEVYDIYLLPPGEDPETCQSYLRIRNRDGRYSLMFEEWFTDSPFIISPRINFVVSVCLLRGLMALGYNIATILKRSSHVFFNDKVCVKTDWLEQINRKYVQVQGRDRLYVKCIAEQLGLDGSYVSRTYIEQIQLEKLVNHVMALPADLRTKLSIDDDITSPKEALSRASAKQRSRYRSRFLSLWSQGGKNLSKLTKLAVHSRKFDGSNPESPEALTKQGVITQIAEQITTLTKRIDECTSRVEEINSKLTSSYAFSSQKYLAVQPTDYNDTAPPSMIMPGNGAVSGTLIPNSASSSQSARELPTMEEIMRIGSSQRQVMRHLDNLNNVPREYIGEMSQQEGTGRTGRVADTESVCIRLVLSLAIGAVGVLLYKSMVSDN